MAGFKLSTDCKDHNLQGHKQSGVYIIHPFDNEIQVNVYCDMVTEGGRWTLTKGGNSSLYVSITLSNGTTLYEVYQHFSVSGEEGNYKLFLGGPAIGSLGYSMLKSGYSWAKLSGMSFSTQLGDSMRSHDMSGMYFTTPDRDNDRESSLNCAITFEGGWWFKNCHLVNLNGPWYPAYWASPWHPTITSSKEIKETLMMIKPH
ncbi:fibroleukin-like [Saccostrea echinata]|uniref:fibroleukin-like n=1 Tax=Saccostrea echinata TaxID=191078 RepID=UPI002A828370|nr:fibroleukin-like [Saccostrea echinata]